MQLNICAIGQGKKYKYLKHVFDTCMGGGGNMYINISNVF